jgi:hypothetical protein
MRSEDRKAAKEREFLADFQTRLQRFGLYGHVRGAKDQSFVGKCSNQHGAQKTESSEDPEPEERPESRQEDDSR